MVWAVALQIAIVELEKLMRFIVFAAVGVASLAASALTAIASPINLVDADDTALNSNPLANDNPTTIEKVLNDLIADYNGDHGASLPPVGTTTRDEVFRVNSGGAAPAGYSSFGSGATSITIPADTLYVVMHWGGSAKDISNYTFAYVGGDPYGALETFAAPGQQGLSWYDGFNDPPPPAPDGGWTACLLGLSLFGLGWMGRKLS